jgi:hypothetical protein
MHAPKVRTPYSLPRYWGGGAGAGGEWSAPCPWLRVTPGKGPPVPTDRSLGGPQSRGYVVIIII